MCHSPVWRQGVTKKQENEHGSKNERCTSTIHQSTATGPNWNTSNFARRVDALPSWEYLPGNDPDFSQHRLLPQLLHLLLRLQFGRGLLTNFSLRERHPGRKRRGFFMDSPAGHYHPRLP